jgi:predicted PurR-regulated permease PerM
MNEKERYTKYSLIIIILLLGGILFVRLIPFLSGILGAITIYALLRGQMKYLSEKKKMKRSLAAILLIGETVLFFLIPLSLFVWLLIGELQTLNLDPAVLMASVEDAVQVIREKTL